MLSTIVRILACSAILLFTLGACQAAPAGEAPSPVPTQGLIRVRATPRAALAATTLPMPTIGPTPAPILIPQSIPTFPPPTFLPTVEWPTVPPPPLLPPTVVWPTSPPPLVLSPTVEVPIMPAPELSPTITFEIPQLLATTTGPTSNPLPTQALHRTSPDKWLRGEAAVLARQGDELFAAGRFTEAIAKYRAAQEHLDQPNQVLHSWLGHSFRALDNLDEVLQQFTAALDIHDNSSDRNNRAMIYLMTNRCPEAQADAQAALAMEPAIGKSSHSDIEALVILAECRMRLGQYD